MLVTSGMMATAMMRPLAPRRVLGLPQAGGREGLQWAGFCRRRPAPDWRIRIGRGGRSVGSIAVASSAERQ